MTGDFVTQNDTEILAISGMRGESLVYEGCQGFLGDAWPGLRFGNYCS